LSRRSTAYCCSWFIAHTKGAYCRDMCACLLPTAFVSPFPLTTSLHRSLSLQRRRGRVKSLHVGISGGIARQASRLGARYLSPNACPCPGSSRSPSAVQLHPVRISIGSSRHTPGAVHGRCNASPCRCPGPLTRHTGCFRAPEPCHVQHDPGVPRLEGRFQ